MTTTMRMTGTNERSIDRRDDETSVYDIESRVEFTGNIG